MTPKQLAEALRIRRRREERALTALQQALALETQARTALTAAEGALSAFDANLQASLDAFHARARLGINPGAAINMRAFHGDQLQVRETYLEPIQMAGQAVVLAEDATAKAREQWRQASQAAENLQELGDETSKRILRAIERREEQDRDEIAAARVSNRD